MCVVFVRKTRMTVVMLQASRDLKQRLITSLLLIAVAGNMTALSALAAHGLVGAVTSDVAGLTAVTAGALVLALAGDVARGTLRGLPTSSTPSVSASSTVRRRLLKTAGMELT